jgi:tetratricopeptide (TPR) repeat protein
MAMGTSGDFFGGYDHHAEAGFVHWADHRISPGKKLWTWGNGEFGYAWDRELTDFDGPYVELMAGVYTDNQPDFTFLAPYETKTFSQYWYPIRSIGPAQAATLDGAVNVTAQGGRARIGVAVTSDRPAATVRLLSGDRVLLERKVHLTPESPLIVEGVELPADVSEADLQLSVRAAGRELVGYRPQPVDVSEPPPPASEPPCPAEVASVEELFLIGVHLKQYRHATRRPEDYWSEALRRAPGDLRSNTALGWWRLERGEFTAAICNFREAIATVTELNPNPYDGEPLYGLGLALRYVGNAGEADEAFAKAAWSAAWRGPARFARAQLAARRGDFAAAIALLDQVVDVDADQLAARSLRAAVWRRLGRSKQAADDVLAVLEADPLDAVALHQRTLLAAIDGVPVHATARPTAALVGGPLPGGVQTALDVAHDYAAAGLLDEAIEVVRAQLPEGDPARPVHPMSRYTLGWLLDRRGDPASLDEFHRAAALPPDYCFPARLEEIEILTRAMSANPDDARAPYYLGNLLYDRRRYREAIGAWRRAARLDPAFPTVHRNLGIAEFNVLERPDRALAAYRRALRADPADPRILYEFDQLRKRCGHSPGDRLVLLERRLLLVDQRDDLTIEYVALLNAIGHHQEALAVLGRRRFHPWEGGEGLVSAQWVLTNLRLAQAALDVADPQCAIERLVAGLYRPDNLGEGKHLLEPDNELHYHLALAHRAAGHDGAAREWFAAAAAAQGDERLPPGEPAYWRARALCALDDEPRATALLLALLRSARRRARKPQRIDYFATSLPTFLVFDDDLDRRNRIECRYLQSLALAGLGRHRSAVRGLRDVGGLDVNHPRAAWHLRVLTADR